MKKKTIIDPIVCYIYNIFFCKVQDMKQKERDKYSFFKVVVITGGAGGIGSAIVHRYSVLYCIYVYPSTLK